MGTSGYVAFIVAYTLLQPFGVPGTVFIVAAPLIWPWPVAFALSMVGTMSASIVGFSVARFLARDWIGARIPARFRKYDDALERRGFRTVLLLRVVFWMPPVLHAFFGVSKVPFWTHFWGSFFGYIRAPCSSVSYLGARIIDAHGRSYGPQALPAIRRALVAASLLPVGAVPRLASKLERLEAVVARMSDVGGGAWVQKAPGSDRYCFSIVRRVH